MIRVIDRYNATDHAADLDGLFRLRHEVFVKELGWQAFDVGGQLEKDQYDNDDAVYLAALDLSGQEVLGCCRLLPTLRPHMLSEIFPQYVEGEVPQRADFTEITRLAVARKARRSLVWAEVFTSAHEYSLAKEQTALTAFVRTIRLPLFQAAGMRVTPLGIPMPCDGELLSAVSLEVSYEVIADMRHRAGLSGSVILKDNASARRIA